MNEVINFFNDEYYFLSNYYEAPVICAIKHLL